MRELPPNATIRILVHSGTCNLHGASFAALPTFRADARGRVSGRGFVRFHGAKIPLRAFTGDAHAVTVVAGTVLACGELRP